jgi:septal ring factor EnvC (AmiA/AmiB activator)
LDSKENNIFYVGIREPIESRRFLLECSKEVIKSLQKYERFRNIRAEKIKHIMELKNLMLDINKQNQELKDKLPKTRLTGSFEKKKSSKKIEKSKITLKKRNTELDKLENELNAIEEKLSSLVNSTKSK